MNRSLRLRFTVCDLLKAGAQLGLALFAMLLVPAELQAQDTYMISGLVRSERGGAPVDRGHVTARLAGDGGSQQRSVRRRGQQSDSDISAETDSSGHFHLVLPSAGSWQIYAHARGFRQQPYERHETFFSSVVLTATRPTYDLVFNIEPDSAIFGTVLDEAGEAVRSARVSLFAAESTNPDVADIDGGMQASAVTDDRGHYEFAGLAPGNYNVGLQAEPWYAAASQGRRSSNAGGPQPDPTLDVVYEQTWFPGVADRRSAEVLSLHHGETRQADFNLNPTPATHLKINPPLAAGAGNQRGQMFPQVERVSADGLNSGNTSIQVDTQGRIDVGGLAPGLYRVTMQGSGGPTATSFLRVPGGAQHSLDLSSAIPVAEITFHFNMEAERVQVILTDTQTGGTFISYAQGNLRRRTNSGAAISNSGERTLEVPPARYRVTLAGDNDVFLSGLAVKGTSAVGRIVNLGSGSTVLDLDLARGRGTVRGTALLGDRPLVGAMVMLVPATFGQPGSITILRRDQTNTDGGFLMENVIPGDYILLAIDHGWTVNWRDPSTLERYLIRGVPVALQSSAIVRQDIQAQSP